MDGPEFQTWQGKLLLSAPRPYKPALGPTQPSIQRVTAAVEWNVTSSPHIHLHGVDIGDFTSTYFVLNR